MANGETSVYHAKAPNTWLRSRTRLDLTRLKSVAMEHENAMIRAQELLTRPRLGRLAVMVCVAAIGAGIGLMAYLAWVQSTAIKTILSNGGQVAYAWESTPLQPQDGLDWRPIRNGLPSSPTWVGTGTRPDGFGPVKAVRIIGAGCDNILARVSDLPSVEWVEVGTGSDLTTKGLAHLIRVKQLRQLAIPNAPIRRLDPLRGQNGLEFLDLSASGVADYGLEPLTDLKNLRMIDLHHTDIGDAGLEHLLGLPHLRHLRLGGTHVTDRGVARLASMKQLEQLDLSGTGITDAALDRLGEAPELAMLDLARTKITDAGLAKLANWKSLKAVNLTATLVSPEGIKALQQARPELKIDW
jgi:hypothetical protein